MGDDNCFGFFNLNLDILKTTDNNLASQQKLLLERNLKKEKEEKSPLEPVIANLIAIHNYILPRQRCKARIVLEELLNNYPENLNTIANLQKIYGGLGRNRDRDLYSKKLDKLLKSNGIAYQKIIAKLEQAYALAVQDKSSNVPFEISMMKAQNLLRFQEERESSNSEKLTIKEARNLIKRAYKEMTEQPDSHFEQTRDAYKSAIRMFDEGIKDLVNHKCSNKEIVIWRFWQAFTFRRLYKFLESERQDDEEEVEKISSEFMKLLCEVVGMIRKHKMDLPLYHSRALAYLGEFLTQGGPAAEKKHLQMPDCLKNCDLDSAWSKPISFFGAAKECQEPCDSEVLNQHGRALARWGDYEEAEKCFYKSTTNEPELNWSAYSGLMKTNLKRYKLKYEELIGRDPESLKKLLDDAYKNGVKCCSSKSGVEDLSCLAEVCLHCGSDINHTKWEYGKCKDSELLYEALEHLHQAMQFHDCTHDAAVHRLMGRCLIYIGETRQAIESMKRAVEADCNDSTDNFPLLCDYLLYLYKERKQEQVLFEMRYVLEERTKRSKEIIDRDELQRLCSKYTEETLKLVNMCAASELKLFFHICMEVLENLATPEEMTRARTESGTHGEPHTIVNSSRDEGSEDMQPDEYEFFVYHSEADSEWVNHILYPALEDAWTDINLKGYPQYPEYSQTLTENLKIQQLLTGITKSRKMLLVLSPEFSRNEWCKYVTHQALFESFEKKKNNNYIIPIMLRSCKIPEELCSISWIDMTSPPYDWQRLRISLH